MKFSIVIPLYNKENQISATLNSVLAQTFQDYEIIVVNDGSTDGSVAAVETFDDPRIRLIHQNNAGVSAARNKGIEEAEGEYIALLDGDDEWKPEYLETISDLISRYPEAQVFATNYEFRDAQGKVKSTILNNLKFKDTAGIMDNYFEVAAHSHPPIWTSAMVATKYAFESIGSFPIGIKSGEDLLTWARLACKFKIAYSLKPLAVFNKDEVLNNDDQNQRIPEEEDYVGKELLILFRNNSDIVGLKDYLSLWHKMRCRIFISKYLKFNALKESLIALKYSPNLKNFVFLFLSLMPHSLSNKIINRFS